MGEARGWRAWKDVQPGRVLRGVRRAEPAGRASCRDRAGLLRARVAVSGGLGGRPVESLAMQPFYAEARFKSHRSVRRQCAEIGAVWNNLMNTPTG